MFDNSFLVFLLIVWEFMLYEALIFDTLQLCFAGAVVCWLMVIIITRTTILGIVLLYLDVPLLLYYSCIYYEFSLIHIFSLVLQPLNVSIYSENRRGIYFGPQKRLKHGRQNNTLHWINGIIRNNCYVIYQCYIYKVYKIYYISNCIDLEI